MLSEVHVTLGIIDTLSTGFNTLFRKPWLALAPVLLDLLLWLGPKLSAAPVIDQAVVPLRQALSAAAAAGAADANMSQMFAEALEELRVALGATNLLSLLAWGRLGLPSIGGLRMIDAQLDQVYYLRSAAGLLGAQALIMAVGLVIACAYLGALAQEVRGSGLDLRALVQRLPTHWLHFVLFLIPLFGVVFVIVFVGSLLGAFALIMWVSLLWILLYLVFVPQAITLAEEGPWGAVRSSFTLVRLFFWPTLGLLVLTNLITLGLGLVWTRLMPSPVGMAVAILANAFIGSGLTVAVFTFYRDRLAMWHEALAARGAKAP
jgi:hypothetical protein